MRKAFLPDMGTSFCGSGGFQELFQHNFAELCPGGFKNIVWFFKFVFRPYPSVLRNHSWLCAQDYKQCQGLNLGLPGARQVSNPLSLRPSNISILTAQAFIQLPDTTPAGLCLNFVPPGFQSE